MTAHRRVPGDEGSRLELAPDARAACSQVGAIVSVNDFAIRPAKPLVDGAELRAGKYCFRFIATPHTPHAWDSGLLFEETESTLVGDGKQALLDLATMITEVAGKT